MIRKRGQNIDEIARCLPLLLVTRYGAKGELLLFSTPIFGKTSVHHFQKRQPQAASLEKAKATASASFQTNFINLLFLSNVCIVLDEYG